MPLLAKTKTFINNYPFIKEPLLTLYKTVKVLSLKPSTIKKEIHAQKLYTAHLNEQPFSPYPPQKSGSCYFLPNLFSEKLLDFVREKKYAQPIVVGNHSFAKKIGKLLIKNGFNSIHFPVLTITTEIPQNCDIIILAARNENALSLIRTLLHTRQYTGDIAVNSATDCLTLPTSKLESATPLVVCSYPCAGTNRFIFGFEYLLKKLGWQISAFSPFVSNVRYIKTLQNERPDDALIDATFCHRIQAMDYFHCMTTHEWFSLEKTVQLDCQTVVLMRDPRDIINSFYWHTVSEAVDTDQHILRIIEGYTRSVGGCYAFNWPSINKIMDTYLFALENPNCHVIRFEDLHKDAGAAFKRLLSDLELYPHPLVPLTEEDIQQAVLLGSFEHQTKGLRRRGESHSGRLKGEHSGISCRKGIVGDWRSSFTPKAIEYFKRLTGDKLMRLGYVTTEDW